MMKTPLIKSLEVGYSFVDESAEQGRFPDFLGIGVQKGGTTWLKEHLESHPEVFIPRSKELQYFNALHISGHRNWADQHRMEQAALALEKIEPGDSLSDSGSYRRELALMQDTNISDGWYRRFFAPASADQLCGEFTPEYSLLPRGGIRHILSHNPNIKIIIILRDPIDRILSQMRMIQSQLGASHSFDWISVLEKSDIIPRSDYATIIRRWHSLVPPANVHIAFYDDLRSRPRPFLRAVCKFLSIAYGDELFSTPEIPIFAGSEFEFPDLIKRKITELAKPLYENLFKEQPSIADYWYSKHFN